MIHWQEKSSAIVSKGLTVAKVTSLAEMHERRAQTQSQYFTPEFVAAGIWEMLSAQRADGPGLSIIDNSVGNGRLIAGAPEEAFIAGVDVDGRCIRALSEDAKAAGRNYQFEHAGLEEVRFNGFAVALINPPFSIQLESPLLEPMDCTSFGRFGPDTSAKSHEYALGQALRGAAVVVAILPQSLDAEMRKNKRLTAVVKLPRNTFTSEGANVATAVYVFGSYASKASLVFDGAISEGEEWPVLPNLLKYAYLRPWLQVKGIDHETAVITAPVTNDRTVTLHKCKKRILPKFACGLTEALVMNALLDRTLKRPDPKHRFPKGMTFRGDTLLEIDLHLSQADPWASLDDLCSKISAAGGIPVMAPTLTGYIKRRISKLQRAQVPFEHWVKTTTAAVTMTAKRMAILDPKDKTSIVRRGESYIATPLDGQFRLELGDRSFVISRSQASGIFTFDDERQAGTDWACVAPGKIAAFPAMAAQYRKRLTELGIDWLWEPQQEAVIEQCINPFGLIAAWQQGTGKARSAIASCLVHGGKNLIVLESALVAEMRIELAKINLPKSVFKFIETPADTKDLRSVNIISYNRLKSVTRQTKRVVAIKGKRANQTFASLLRRRINVMACDEGSVLANAASLQSRALQHVSAKKAIIFDGTPIRSYPRDILSQLQVTSGTGPHQPYAPHSGTYIDARVLEQPNFVERATDVFQEHFVTYDWVTSLFKESMSDGAKREIPQIKDLDRYRGLLGANVQRILRAEPRMVDYCYSEEPIYNKPIEPQWDEGHLRFYLEVATSFAQWYMEVRKRAGEANKGINLVAVLAKINAVIQAANCPHRQIKDWPGVFTAVTSKERAAVELCKRYTADSKKTILYARSPATVERLRDLLDQEGIYALPFHGEMDIKKRNALLDSEFRYGEATVLLSTWVGQRGLNLPQASRVIGFQRHWNGDTEQQAIQRTCRPEQTDTVTVDNLHLPGSIDVYQAQLVEWKVAAADSGLDWGNAATSEDEFVHLDTILVQFCQDTLNMSVQDLLNMRQAAA